MCHFRRSKWFVSLLLMVACSTLGARSREDQACSIEMPQLASDSSFQERQVAEQLKKADISIASSVGRSCSIDASMLVTASHVVLVDVRLSSTVDVWIPGAVQLSLGEISTHALIKSASMAVLIGDGKDTAVLLRQCAEWQQRGLSQIRVLDGGLPAWYRAGGAVAGSATILDQVLVLNAREVNRTLRQAPATVMFVGVAPTSAWHTHDAHLVRVPQAASPLSALRYARATRKSTVVIVLPSSHAAEKWRQAARSLALAEPFFFVGEASRYDAYLREQASIDAHANQTPISTCERG